MSEEKHINILPLEKKPSYTIQDAYLGKYFISSSISDNDNMLGKKRNENIIKKEAVLHKQIT